MIFKDYELDKFHYNFGINLGGLYLLGNKLTLSFRIIVYLLQLKSRNMIFLKKYTNLKKEETIKNVL